MSEETKVNLVLIHCGNCGIIFGVPAAYQEERAKDGKTFCCPNGCKRKFVLEENTEEECLKTQATALRERVAFLEQSRSSYKGQVTKLKKRMK